jgi:Subtilisin inhibitor-like
VRGLLLVAVAVLASVAGAASAAPSGTALTITYWSDGSRPADKTVWTLRCDPARGTLKRPARACRHIAAGGRRLFAPVKQGAICTEIYGGPQIALITGTVDGKRVWARLQRRDGCEIARWMRLSPWLLPPGGVG